MVITSCTVVYQFLLYKHKDLPVGTIPSPSIAPTCCRLGGSSKSTTDRLIDFRMGSYPSKINLTGMMLKAVLLGVPKDYTQAKMVIHRQRLFLRSDPSLIH